MRFCRGGRIVELSAYESVRLECFDYMIPEATKQLVVSFFLEIISSISLWHERSYGERVWDAFALTREGKHSSDLKNKGGGLSLSEQGTDAVHILITNHELFICWTLKPVSRLLSLEERRKSL